MSEDQDRVWAELEARAQRLLEHAKEVEPREVARPFGSLLRLWHHPAFGPLRTWTILTPSRRTAGDVLPRVREITWDRDADHQRVFEGRPGQRWQPSIELRETALPGPETCALLEAGASLSVSLVGVCHTAGVDGDYFGLETYEVSPNVRTQWWAAGPVEWRHFTGWVAELRGFLVRCLDQTG